MFLAKRSPWILVVAALLAVHAVQALIHGVSAGYSAPLSALARVLAAAYLVAIWHFLTANRLIAWRLVLGLRVGALLLFITTGIVFIVNTTEWWLKAWYAVVLFTVLAFAWYYGLRPFLRARDRFVSEQPMT